MSDRLKNLNLSEIGIGPTGYKAIDGVTLLATTFRLEDTRYFAAVTEHAFPPGRILGPAMRFLPGGSEGSWYGQLRREASEINSHLGIMFNWSKSGLDLSIKGAHFTDPEVGRAMADFMGFSSKRWKADALAQCLYGNSLEELMSNRLIFATSDFYDKTVASIRRELRRSKSVDDANEILQRFDVEGRFRRLRKSSPRGRVREFNHDLNRFSDDPGMLLQYAAAFAGGTPDNRYALVYDNPFILPGPTQEWTRMMTFLPHVKYFARHLNVKREGNYLDLWVGQPDRPTPPIARFDLAEVDQESGTYPQARLIQTTLSPDQNLQPVARPALLWSVDSRGNRKLGTQRQLSELAPTLGFPNPEQADLFAGTLWTTLLRDDLPILYDEDGRVSLRDGTRKFPINASHVLIKLHSSEHEPWVMDNPLFQAVEQAVR